MLLERVYPYNNLPFSITFSNVIEEDYHYHKEMEIMFVLRGKANCKIHHWNYTLLAGDVLIADTEDLHRIYNSSEDILMLTMYIDLECFTESYPNLDYIIWAPENCTQGSAAMQQTLKNKNAFLKSYMAKIMSIFVSHKDDDALLMKEINEFIFILVNQFQGFFIEDMQFKLGNNDASEVDQERILRIIKYIYLNYDKKITLEDLAAQEYLSTYYISHLIKKITGLNFQNFLNYIRVEFAEKLLVEGKLSLTQISEFCGFSSLAYFDKCFQAWHGMTPAQYRHTLCPCNRRYGADFTEEEAMALLDSYLDNRQRYQKKDIITRVPQLVYIPVDYLYTNGKDFRKSFALRISLNTAEDIFYTLLYEKELNALKPSHIYIGPAVVESVSNRQTVLDMLYTFLEQGCIAEFTHESSFSPIQKAHTAAEAFRYMLKKKSLSLSVIGSQGSLITKEGLFTPWYYLYEIFSRIEGNITGQGEQYIKVKSKDTMWIFVFQDNNNCGLKAHININNGAERCTIIETRFNADNSCYAALDRFEGMPFAVKDCKEYINQSSAGVCKIRWLHPEELPALCMDIEPESFICLGICF